MATTTPTTTPPADTRRQGVELRLRIRIPAPSSLLLINLLGVGGLGATAVAVGGLTGTWWWTLLAAGVAMVALAVIGSTYATSDHPTPAAAAVARPAVVPGPGRVAS